jgi:Carboxypeptidase regulatory-like domain
VLDASDRGISGASVLLTDLETHKTDAIYAGTDGRYTFSGLNAYDDYDIRARYQGQTSTTREVSSMDPRLQIVVNLTVSPHSQK